jgi:hypothetical protein
VSLLTLMYTPMYSVRARMKDIAMLFMSLAGIFATFPASTAAAKSGKTSIELICAPRARARLFQRSVGSLVFQVSRLVRGLYGLGQSTR